MGIVRGILTVVSSGALLGALVVFVARYLPVVSHPVLIAALAGPIALIASPVAAVGLALAGRWTLTALAVVVTVVVVAVAAPSFVSAKASGTSVRVMSMNMQFGRADAWEIVELARRDVDILAVQEMTPKAAERLSAAGLDAILPYRFIDPQRGPKGIGLWSRLPLTDTALIEGYEMPAVIGRVEIAGVAVHPAVASIHLMPPWPPPVRAWRHDIGVLPNTLSDLARAAGDGAVLAAGDFNSTNDMREFRGLLTGGYRDAAEQAGVPFAPTYPADRFTPVIAIDHVLTRNATGERVETARVRGTDHMALIVDVIVDGGAVS